MLAAMERALRLLYVDQALLVAEKAAGLLAVPGRGVAGADSLTARVQACYRDALIVHRLDMATSGLMVFALGAFAQRRLSMAFERRQVIKHYVAIVEGCLAADDGEIDAPLAADWPRRPMQKVDLEQGKPSLTRWQVIERGVDFTRLALMPITGRTHQLRVHLQHIGHPIRGDALYGTPLLAAARLLLHACAIEFAHPLSGQPLSFKSEPAF